MFSIVVARDTLGGIGKENDIPWRLPGDMKYFKELTTSKDISEYISEREIDLAPDRKIDIPSNDSVNNVIMGRKTWESIPEEYRPLPERINIILSRSKPPPILTQHCFTSLDDALEFTNKFSNGHTFVIGGSEIYNEAIKHPDCEYLFITEVSLQSDSDKHFVGTTDDFEIIGTSKIQTSKKGIEYHFTIYKRK
jgi:dihydrofolate reductase